MSSVTWTRVLPGHQADEWSAETDDGDYDGSGPDPLAAALDLADNLRAALRAREQK